MSVGRRRMIVTSSACATTFGYPLSTKGLFSCSIASIMQRNGFIHIVNNNMLKGHPCLIPLRIAVGCDICPLIWTEEVAFVYIFCNRVKKVLLKPQCSNTLNRYVCAILSKTSVKSRDKRHVGELVISTCAIVSRIPAMAPNMLVSCVPQCWLAALRSSCATLREWSHNLHPPSCSG